MKYCLALPRLRVGVSALLFALAALPTHLNAQGRFGPIRIGAPTSGLPLVCNDSHICNALYDNTAATVYAKDGFVEGIRVLYTEYPLSVESTPITLGQSIKRHSLAPGMKPPRFGPALDINDEFWGVCDFANLIIYPLHRAKEISLSFAVVEVNYKSERQAVFKEAEEKEYSPELTAKLISDSAASSTYKSTMILTMDEQGNYESRAAVSVSRDGAALELKEHVDEIIGSGRMVSTLIDQVSTWYTVDKDHPTAAKKEAELRSQYQTYSDATDALRKFVNSNRGVLAASDLKLIPIELFDQIDSKMRQLKAMGFRL
jgi:hypothetical protein